MATPTFAVQALVCRRTKLGETDVIVTLLDSDGQERRAVAKGARKPSSPFASRLEEGSVCRLLLARGRSLDIVKEAKIVESNQAIRLDHERFAAAATVLELASKAAVPDLPNPKLFALCTQALSQIGAAPVDACPALAAACLLKALAFCGFKPSFNACISCGAELDAYPALRDPRAQVRFSAVEGGYVCRSCAREVSASFEPAGLLRLGHQLLYSTFSQVAQLHLDAPSQLEALRLSAALARAHLQARFTSVDFLSSMVR